MGGLSRKISYINTLKNNNIEPIILDAGDALFARPQYPIQNLPSEKYKAKAFLEGYEQIGCDALNIGEYDLVGGFHFLKSLEKKSTIPFISANLRLKKTDELAFKPYVIVKKNKLNIGIIGLTDYLSKDVSELYKEDYLEAGTSLINKLRDEVDILVILVNGNVNQKEAILESFKDADYVYLSRTISNTRITAPQKDGYPIFYTIGLNGKQLIEVKTTIKDDNKKIADIASHDIRLSNIVRQLIRLKTTEGNQTVQEKYADKPAILAQIQHFENQVVELEEQISKIVNKSEIKIVGLPKKMEFDKDMQFFVDKTLEEAKAQ
jgi:2',3'-cyclic-nucleotide 2'-phosphodiesterase (5'-nucleotidase family)